MSNDPKTSAIRPIPPHRHYHRWALASVVRGDLTTNAETDLPTPYWLYECTDCGTAFASIESTRGHTETCTCSSIANEEL